MSSRTLYDVLGVKPTATPSQIRIAYHKLAKTYHPDRNPEDATKMEEINNSYAVLKNPTRKSEYDQHMNYQRKEIPDFVDMKTAAKNFFTPVENLEKTDPVAYESSKKLAKRMFEDETKIMNMKNGISEDKMNPINDFTQKVDDYELSRKQEDIEIMPDLNDQLRHLSVDEFNKKFNDEFEKNIDNQLAMIGYKEPDAYFGNVREFDSDNFAKIEDDTVCDIQKPINMQFGTQKTMRAGALTDNKPVTEDDIQKLIQERDEFNQQNNNRSKQPKTKSTPFRKIVEHTDEL